MTLLKEIYQGVFQYLLQDKLSESTVIFVDECLKHGVVINLKSIKDWAHLFFICAKNDFVELFKRYLRTQKNDVLRLIIDLILRYDKPHQVLTFRIDPEIIDPFSLTLTELVNFLTKLKPYKLDKDSQYMLSDVFDKDDMVKYESLIIFLIDNGYANDRLDVWISHMIRGDHLSLLQYVLRKRPYLILGNKVQRKAILSGSINTMKFFLRNNIGDKWPKALIHAAETNNIIMFRILSDLSYYQDLINSDHSAVLSWFSYHGNVVGMIRSLELGADPNQMVQFTRKFFDKHLGSIPENLRKKLLD